LNRHDRRLTPDTAAKAVAATHDRCWRCKGTGKTMQGVQEVGCRYCPEGEAFHLAQERGRPLSDKLDTGLFLRGLRAWEAIQTKREGYARALLAHYRRLRAIRTANTDKPLFDQRAAREHAVRMAREEVRGRPPPHPLEVPARVKRDLAFSASPVPSIGTEYYSCCGAEDAAGYARDEARERAKKQAALAVVMQRVAPQLGWPLRDHEARAIAKWEGRHG
jgi:hypothetical protein